MQKKQIKKNLKDQINPFQLFYFPLEIYHNLLIVFMSDEEEKKFVPFAEMFQHHNVTVPYLQKK